MERQQEIQRWAYRADAGSSVNHQVFGLFDGYSQLPHFIFQLISMIKYLQSVQEK